MERNPSKPTKKTDASLVRSSAAEYLTFVAATGGGGVEVVYADESIWLTQNSPPCRTSCIGPFADRGCQPTRHR